MVINKKYCSYIPALIKALEMVEGDVLELGAGPISTFLLHWMCKDQDRYLCTYEKDLKYYMMVKHCQDVSHNISLVEDWDLINIEKPWGVVLVDHEAERRKLEVERLAHYAQCLVIHDSGWRGNKHYRYSEIYPLFKYKQSYGKPVRPPTKFLSNFVDVTKW